MSTYLVFAGENYYPCGGIDDLAGRFSEFSQAVDCLSEKIQHSDWGQIFCVDTGETWGQFRRGRQNFESKRYEVIYTISELEKTSA